MWIFAEMFSGIGGFRLGLERSGWKCVWSNDLDKYACQVYRRNFGDRELVEGDIRAIDIDAIPEHTLLTAGFPCQSFSLAGKRKGFEDTRGTLFYDIARIASAKRPKLLLLENVKGLLSNDKGRTFAKILQTLDGLGYDVEWQVLNSKHFGVPQNRERVFIVGHLRGTGSRQIFPIGQAPANANRTCKKAQAEGTRFRVANSLNVGGSGRERNLIASALIHSRGLETRDDDVSHSLKGAGGGSSKNFVVANTLRSRYLKDGSENLILEDGIQIYDVHHKLFSKEMGTLTGRENRQGTNWLLMTAHTKANIKQRIQNRENAWTLDGTKGKMAIAQALQTDGFLRQGYSFGTDNPQSSRNIRRLTPVECERLQSFPDGWTEGVSDTQRYKLLGNAVTVNVVEYLGRRIIDRCLQRKEA